MTVIGEIIKKALDLGEKISSNKSTEEMQLDTLNQLLEKAKDTEFGKHYQFDQILKSENLAFEFAKTVPYHNYDQIFEKWWSKIREGKPDITWPGINEYFAVSSGTTSNSKFIPVTNDMLDSIKRTGMKQVVSLSKYDMPADFFERQIMMLGSSTDLKENNGFLEGEISGISASKIPFWFKNFYKPGEKISSIEDWDERTAKIAEEALNWDIGSISGIPSWIELMMKKVIEHHKVNNIHEIWPNLAVYTPGGVAFEPHRKSFEKLLAHPLIYIDTYLASEGFLAFQSVPNSDSMELVLDNGIYFEFVPFLPENITEDGTVLPEAKALGIDEVKEEQDYILLISTVSGAWRYMIGDTIKFTNTQTASIKITGRTKFFLNVVGSQLSVHQMDKGIETLQQKFDLVIPEYTVSAVKRDGEYIHQWYLGVDKGKENSPEIADYLDKHLQENNKNYKVARSKALKGVQVNLVPVDVFNDYNEKQKKKGGQVKFARVMKEEDLLKWEAFLEEHDELDMNAENQF